MKLLRVKPFARFFIGLSLAIFATLGFAVAPASAHDRLIDTTPNAGATVKSTPTKVTLTFNEAVLKIGTDVRVVHAHHDYATGAAKVAGSKVTQKLKADLPNGKYKVTWRVVSADGHPVGASFTFKVKQSTAVATAVPLSSPATVSASSSPSATSASPVSAPESTAQPNWIWTIVVAIIGLAVLVSIVTWLGRRK